MTGGDEGPPAASLILKSFKGLTQALLSAIYCSINEGRFALKEIKEK